MSWALFAAFMAAWGAVCALLGVMFADGIRVFLLPAAGEHAVPSRRDLPPSPLSLAQLAATPADGTRVIEKVTADGHAPWSESLPRLEERAVPGQFRDADGGEHDIAVTILPAPAEAEASS